MLLPEPWDNNGALSPERRAYDAYQSMLMEPWDGPAAIAFTDGRTLGAALDRNGLRPARYYVTRDDRFLLSSEVGTIDVDPEDILATGCLGPGEMLEVDFARGRIIYNDELRRRYAKEKPYRDWIAEETLELADLADGSPLPREDAEVPAALSAAKLGHHFDDVEEIVRPMATTGKTPLASMGIDAPLACLSTKTRSFFDYFYELFRPGHQPAYRRPARELRHLHHPLPRQPRQPARGRARGVPSRPAAPTAPDRGRPLPHRLHRQRELPRGAPSRRV